MIKFHVKGLAELQRNFSRESDKLEVYMKPALEESVTVVQRDAKKEVTVDTGSLRGSIKKEVRRLTGTVTAAEDYAIFIEEGTRAHFPPVAPLERWAQRKLGAPGLGFVIARKIAREGTKPQPFMVPALEKNAQNIQMFFDRAAQNFLRQLGK